MDPRVVDQRPGGGKCRRVMPAFIHQHRNHVRGCTVHVVFLERQTARHAQELIERDVPALGLDLEDQESVQRLIAHTLGVVDRVLASGATP